MSSAPLPASRILSISPSLSRTETYLPTATTTITQESQCNSHNGNNVGATSAPLTPQNTTRPPTTSHHIKYFGAGAYPSYVVLSVTRPTTTYTTIVPLGNSFPTDASSSASPPETTAQTPGIPTSSIVGIIVGCILAFGMLAGVFYVYALRAKRHRFMQRRGGSSRKTTSTGTRSRRSRRSSSGAGGQPPPPGGVFPPAGEP
ncbi:uncharacterized protein BP5553_03951 [Venustampulla echinocandica]|uniref:Mid2 domain-containing protein n=1 Tax=Venustampulla echinocandica TaxID=2656787 RepID=A0A370TVQ7_9HELO|nr:uncharacterized protein BP5553_03951 [Venustampulla echinocandica]RDL39611.1 hypothetical protein BP5553_03951 [Venustampulla echinocandica]